MATIKQIAQKSGVSPTTVSNVLHGRTTKVSPEKLKEVRAILKSENYTPNLAAQILAHNKSHIIGVIVYKVPRMGETIFEDPFTGTILGAFEEEIRKQGYYMMLHVTHDPDEVLKLSATWKLDGLLVLWVAEDLSSELIENTDTPIVFIDCYFEKNVQTYYNVRLDDYKGAYDITSYLISMGHKKIAIVVDGDKIRGSFEYRLKGYKQALLDAGIEFTNKNLVQLSLDPTGRSKNYKNLCEADENFTALIFMSDYYAAEATSFFQEHNVAIPDRFSIVGFDNNIYSRLVHPRITTVHQDVFERGTVAVDMLMKLIKGEEVVQNDIRMPVRLVLRDSVKSIKT